MVTFTFFYKNRFWLWTLFSFITIFWFLFESGSVSCYLFCWQGNKQKNQTKVWLWWHKKSIDWWPDKWLEKIGRTIARSKFFISTWFKILIFKGNAIISIINQRYPSCAVWLVIRIVIIIAHLNTPSCHNVF